MASPSTTADAVVPPRQGRRRQLPDPRQGLLVLDLHARSQADRRDVPVLGMLAAFAHRRHVRAARAHRAARAPGETIMEQDTYNQLFTLHGAIMVFLVIIPGIPAALGNFILPLQLGAKDVAFPRLNLASYLPVAAWARRSC